MPQAQSEIFIAAPPEKVWALISDLERGPEWSVVTLRCEITSGKPLGVGSTYCALSKFVASQITTEHEIVEWVPPSRVVSKVTKGAESTLTQTCDPQGDGTLLTMSNQFALPRGVPGPVADKVVQQVTSTLYREVARIKEVVEGSSAGEAPGDEADLREGG